MADGLWDQINRVVSIFASSEVKTPLSFAFRMALYVAILAAVIVLFSSLNDTFKESVLIFAGAVWLLLILAVFLFAWNRPTNLVYGETGHRAERKLMYGTNRKIQTAIEIESEKPIPNPAQLPPPEEPTK